MDCGITKMAKYQYLEIKPKYHKIIFNTKGELYAYWEKRFKKYSNFDYINDPSINPKDFFDYEITTLNKDGSPRRKTEFKPLTKKQRENHEKAMELQKIMTQNRAKLRFEIEKELETALKEKGFDGKINIKFFKGERKHYLKDPKHDLFEVSNGNLIVLQTIPEMMKYEEWRSKLRMLILEYKQAKILQNHAERGFI